MSSLNRNGQPSNKAFGAARVNARKIDELVGLCRGVLLDGIVNESEASGLLAWIERNREISNTWPANVLYERLSRMMQDGHLDGQEESELLEFLMQLTGEPIAVSAHEFNSTDLPFCNPAPEVLFEGVNFCLTGKFVAGSRAEMKACVEAFGGTNSDNVTKSTRYLVVGSIGSRDWMHSTFGRKIEKAIAMREGGQEIAIVGEKTFCEHLPTIEFKE